LERDFRYLRDKHGDAGAREVFEKICIQLLQTKFENAYPVAVHKGDGGIDVFVGDFSEDIDVYQCKYFIAGIGDSQRSQIRDSFKTAVTSKEYTLKEWYLCVPCILNVNEQKWWAGWKKRMEERYNKKIKLLDGSYLITELKILGIYDTLFDNETITLLNEILENLQNKKRYYQEMIYELDDSSELDYDGCIFIKKLDIANITEKDMCKKEFFNAEIVRSSIESKGNPEELKMYSQLKSKIQSLWQTQYLTYNDENDGNVLLSKTYERIEDLDTTTLKAADDISMVAKKGILHQLSDKCKVGWTKNYSAKLEEALAEGEEE